MSSKNRITRPIALTAAADVLLERATARLGVSRSAVVEMLVHRYADSVPLDVSVLPPDHRGLKGNGRRKKPSHLP